MAGIRVLRIPLPRVVVGVPRGGRRQAESHVVVDEDVPVALSEADDDDAPVALRLHAGKDEEHFRAHGGALYQPMTWHVGYASMPRAGMPLSEMGPRIVPWIRYEMNMKAGAASVHGAPLLDWRARLNGHLGNGIVPAAERQFRSVLDDGMAGRAEVAEAISRHLLVVDGGLYRRVQPPVLRVTVHGEASDPRIASGIETGSWPTEGVPDVAWNGFPPHLADEMAAYARRVASELGGHVLAARSDVEVVDAAALATAYDWTPRGRAVAMAARMVDVSSKIVTSLPDAAITTWMRLRATARSAPDVVDPGAVLVDVATLSEAIAPGVGLLPPHHSEPGRIASEGRRMIHLAESLDAPHLSTDDDLALAGLSGPR